MSIPIPGRIPLVSGPPPVPANVSEDNCRRCHKEFGIFTRPKRCYHCGYAYCSSCCEYQALCPRDARQANQGYERVDVCAYCNDMLLITASSQTEMRSMSVAKLKDYLKSYNIKPRSVLEKDDLIAAIMEARGTAMCLNTERENYYRRETIPKRASVEARTRNPFQNFSSNVFGHSTQNSPSSPPPRQQPTERSRRASTPPGGQERWRPQPQPQSQQNPYPPPQYPPPPQSQRPPYGHSYHSRPPPSTQGQYHYQQYQPRRPQGQAHFQSQSPPPPQPNPHLRPDPQPTPPRRPQSTPPQRTQPRASTPPPMPSRAARPSEPAIPTLVSLLDTPHSEISKFSIGALKGILYANHVNAGQIIEKRELVEKVKHLIDIERNERERERIIHEREEKEQQERLEQLRRAKEETERLRARERNGGVDLGAGIQEPSSSKSNDATPPPDSPKPTSPPQTSNPLERDSSCVVCQDEESNIAIVDCGHLCLCKSCSDIIMSTTRECPLCRTRIVTEQRLLRIFRS